ncbi:S-adenosylmethionine sensor upstream of mTORC1-like [Clytia hemisphaerica]|uniref:S-adenosylmethionine sensor upstream of mTORC1-like n=1 Tax=Clytia hemisphaerica TaxID=252671 RepID=UPI0034D47961
MSDHANVVKNLHKSLRNEFKHGISEDEIWDKHIQNKESLQNYAESMCSLAKNSWRMDNNNRIKWCLATISYYYEGGLLKVLRKELKTKKFEDLRSNNIEESPEEHQRINFEIENTVFEIEDTKKLLLDVGSCYNPFGETVEYTSIAIDIAPANEDVIFCDFLNLNFSAVNEAYTQIDDIKTNLKSGSLLTNTFNVVVFSLLLSYFPSPKQRLKCCVNASYALKINGLILIITPDSSHQNRHQGMMKSWKNALEEIGFVRFKYEKLEHLHCMAYRKVKESAITESLMDALSGSFYIPQDFQEVDNESQLQN